MCADWNRLIKQVQQGHNVVIMANHQTEVDPAVVSLLVGKSHPMVATDMINVAGDRVVTDPIFKVWRLEVASLWCVDDWMSWLVWSGSIWRTVGWWQIPSIFN